MSSDKPKSPKKETREASEAAAPTGVLPPKDIAVLHAALRRLPEQTWPGRSQQETTHRYI
jgi:hypothetical protein